jgi:pyridoxamine 5'-phosphate oxidase
METRPIALFLRCRARAIEAGAPFDGAAAVLATASASGVPSARAVLVKEVSEDGFFVYTNYQSRKARELDENPQAALCVHWPEIAEQFRVEGRVERASEARSETYFQSRPRESQLGAWASAQSQPIPDREHLEARFAELEREHEGRPVPRPPHWGGYRSVPARIEHWISGDHRLHDRFVYERTATGWTVARIAP